MTSKANHTTNNSTLATDSYTTPVRVNRQQTADQDQDRSLKKLLLIYTLPVAVLILLLMGLVGVNFWYTYKLSSTVENTAREIETLNTMIQAINQTLVTHDANVRDQLEAIAHQLQCDVDECAENQANCDEGFTGLNTCGCFCCRRPATDPAPPVCSGQSDIVFVVDSSGSINRDDSDNWGRLLEFILDVVSNARLTVGQNHVRIGVVVYSDYATIELLLRDSVDVEQVSNVIRNLPYINGRTNIAAGLELARTQVFLASEGDRANANNAIILISDGMPNEREEETIPQAQMAKNEGIRIVSVGITDEVDEAQMKQISSDGKLIFATSFQDLDSIISDLIDQTCGDPSGGALA